MRKAPYARGFTLVEVLVATTLLTLVIAGLLTAMRSFAQTEERIDRRIRSDEDLRAAGPFLRSVISTVSPRLRAVPAGSAKQIDFSGGTGSLRWIGVMPARHGAGGLYRFHLHARPANADETAALLLEFSPYAPGIDAALDPAGAHSRVMATGVGEVAFRYRDDPRFGGEWLAEWPHADRLPTQIGLHVRGGSRAWPEIVVAVIPVVGPASVGRAGGLISGPIIGPF